MSKSFNNRVMDTVIIPSGFSDHHMITIDISKKQLLDRSIIGILIKNYYIISYFVRVLLIFGKIGDYRKIIMKLKVNGGRLERCILKFSVKVMSLKYHLN